MYIKNSPFVVVDCETSFENDCRMVVLDVHDKDGARLRVKLPECLMAAITGQFLKDRLFGLH